MASIEGASGAGVAQRGDAGSCGRAVEYLVPHWVRVRRESFGLLFYDIRSTRLTYVRSGESLSPPPFTGGRRALEVCPPGSAAHPALARLLRSLVEKGLIVAVEA